MQVSDKHIQKRVHPSVTNINKLDMEGASGRGVVTSMAEEAR